MSECDKIETGSQGQRAEQQCQRAWAAWRGAGGEHGGTDDQASSQHAPGYAVHGLWPVFYNNFKWTIIYKNIEPTLYT